MAYFHQECIVFLLAKAYQKAHGRLKNLLQPHGLTPIQHLILAVLLEEEGLSAGEIGKRLVLDSATLSGVLDRLSDKGWIVKVTDQDDKRFIRIYLSDQAKETMPRLASKRDEVNEDLLGHFTMEEKVLLKRLLRDLNN